MINIKETLERILMSFGSRLLGEDFIQNKYRICLENGRLEELVELQNTTGIQPNLPKDFVQEVYRRYTTEPPPDYLQRYPFSEWAKKGLKQLRWISDLKEITGIEPPEDVAKETHRTLLQEMMDVEQEYNGPSAYLKLQDINANLMCIKELRDITGVEPHADDVQKTYKDFVQKGLYDHGYLESLQDLRDITGVELKLPEDLIQEVYRTGMREGQLFQIGMIINIVKIKPREEDVQEMYRAYALKGRADDLDSLRKTTGIEPPDDIVKEAHRVSQLRTYSLSGN